MFFTLEFASIIIQNCLFLTFTLPILLSIEPVLFFKEFISVLGSFMSQERIQWRH